MKGVEKHFACVWPSTTHAEDALPLPHVLAPFNLTLHSHWPVCTTCSMFGFWNIHTAKFLFQNWLPGLRNFDISADSHTKREWGEREIQSVLIYIYTRTQQTVYIEHKPCTTGIRESSSVVWTCTQRDSVLSLDCQQYKKYSYAY